METTMHVNDLTEPPVEGPSWSSLFQRLLDDGADLDDVLIDDDARTTALPRMLLVAFAGLALFGFAVGLTAQFAAPHAGTPVVWVPLSLVGGFFTAMAVGLPSFYFYTQLAGLDASFRLVTAQAVRIQSRTSILLLGVLPFYAAIALGSVLDVVWVDELLVFLTLGLASSPATSCIAIGFALPFLVGFAGLWSVYRSFRRLVTVLPITHPRRGNILLRLVLAWSVMGAAVAPIAMYRIAEWLWTVT